MLTQISPSSIQQMPHDTLRGVDRTDKTAVRAQPRISKRFS